MLLSLGPVGRFVSLEFVKEDIVDGCGVEYPVFEFPTEESLGEVEFGAETDAVRASDDAEPVEVIGIDSDAPVGLIGRVEFRVKLSGPVGEVLGAKLPETNDELLYGYGAEDVARGDEISVERGPVPEEG